MTPRLPYNTDISEQQWQLLKPHLPEASVTDRPIQQYSASKVLNSQLGELPDEEFIAQFNEFPISINFQRTRNSTAEDGDTRRNRYYRVGEIDIVAACLFSKTMEWKFLYAMAKGFKRHSEYTERYSNRLRIKPGIWAANLSELINI